MSKVLENRARRAAKRVGLIATKSRSRRNVYNRGGFKIVDRDTNLVVAGRRFECSPEDVIEMCTAWNALLESVATTASNSNRR
jgi:hypothetical protein